MYYFYDMNNERLFNVVLLEFSSERLKLEADLEDIVSSNDSIDVKTKLIKKYISKLVKIEANIEKFNTMISNNNNITTEKKD